MLLGGGLLYGRKEVVAAYHAGEVPHNKPRQQGQLLAYQKLLGVSVQTNYSIVC